MRRMAAHLDGPAALRSPLGRRADRAASRSGRSRSHLGPLGEPPGKRGCLKANVRDGDRLPEGGLAHRPDGKDSLRSAPARVNESAIVVDVEANAEGIGARVALGDELGDERIGAAPWIAGQPSAGDDGETSRRTKALDARGRIETLAPSRFALTSRRWPDRIRNWVLSSNARIFASTSGAILWR